MRISARGFAISQVINLIHNIMKIHKLRITKKRMIDTITNEDGTTFENEYYLDESHVLELLIQNHKDKIVAIAIVGETGLIPFPTEYDEEGNPLPVTFREGYHVDVMTTEVIQEWKPYTVTGEHEWAHSFGYGEVVTAEEFV